MPVSVYIWLPATFVDILDTSKKLEKNFAGLVTARAFITVNGYADDLLHEVSAGA